MVHSSSAGLTTNSICLPNRVITQGSHAPKSRPTFWYQYRAPTRRIVICILFQSSIRRLNVVRAHSKLKRSPGVQAIRNSRRLGRSTLLVNINTFCVDICQHNSQSHFAFHIRTPLPHATLNLYTSTTSHLGFILGSSW